MTDEGRGKREEKKLRRVEAKKVLYRYARSDHHAQIN